jgi:hypothetical protein
LTPLALDPFSSVKLLSLPSKHKEVTFFYVKKTFLQNKGKAKKNEALKWKKIKFYCIENIIPRKFTRKISGFFSPKL